MQVPRHTHNNQQFGSRMALILLNNQDGTSVCKQSSRTLLGLRSTCGASKTNEQCDLAMTSLLITTTFLSEEVCAGVHGKKNNLHNCIMATDDQGAVCGVISSQVNKL